MGYVAALGGVAAVTAFYKLEIPNVNVTTVALSFLLVVLLVSSARGLAPGIVASVAAMGCFNFFFLPPFGTLTVEDPQNWVALAAFLITAVITSQLSAAARWRAREAEARREELWKLYRLSQSIVINTDPETAIAGLLREVVREFDAAACAVFVKGEGGDWQRRGVATGGGAPEFAPQMRAVEDCFQSGEFLLAPVTLGDEATAQVAYAPLRVGVKSIGVLALLMASLSDEYRSGQGREVERGTMEAIAGLVALALERAKFLQEVSRTEALRQSDELKAALLASVSHDLRTPLTAMRAAVDSLLQPGADWDSATLTEFHSILREEVERLTRLVQNLLEMARIEAGELRLAKRWTAVAEIVTSVVDRCREATRQHQVIIDVDEQLPLVRVDSLLVAEALAQLVENAARYSPAASSITIGGALVGQALRLWVGDEGIGIAATDRQRIFDKFYRAASEDTPRGSGTRGTGMGLAIARGIIEAHGGSIFVESAPGKGSVFTLEIPVETQAASLLTDAAPIADAGQAPAAAPEAEDAWRASQV